MIWTAGSINTSARLFMLTGRSPLQATRSRQGHSGSCLGPWADLEPSYLAVL